ncbi:class I SAM-dependent methyltransferase [Rhizobium halophytocola]|uniref:Phospholipid N-methyltransferase n=1 Tax=Rhizobium halophytocola TaxID=735519 RepID=A0ABS4E4R3_9HYPH|nr:methyltransferase domain-containing protein [Rhizobium halophytocola]MBP1852902.1 phospholipid N-methyltransferase [Rhizobium halophytocola]
MYGFSAAQDYVRFFGAWVANPIRVAAIAPSSASLSRLMTREISTTDGPLLELGAGTGVFTKAMIARGVNERDLTLIEYGEEFAALLRRRFPQSCVLQMDAVHIAENRVLQNRRFSAVISGLPLLSMAPGKVEAILANAFDLCRNDAAFYQFTYGPRCPVSPRILQGLKLEATLVGATIRNLPPSAVYRIARRRHADPQDIAVLLMCLG